MIFLCIPLTILFFMLGGQINKLFRPIGVPLSIILCSWSWYALSALPYGITLTLGYGENSKLMKWLKSEQKVRIVCGLLDGIPVLIAVLLKHHWWALVGIPAIVAVECVRMGSWGKVGKYDILPVDIFRGAIRGIAMVGALI